MGAAIRSGDSPWRSELVRKGFLVRAPRNCTTIGGNRRACGGGTMTDHPVSAVVPSTRASAATGLISTSYRPT